MNKPSLRVAMLSVLVFGHALLSSPPVAAQDYPAKMIRWVVPFPPGGATDLVTRALAQRLAEVLRQPVVVENRPGASGGVGVDAVATAPGDGYTLLTGGSSNITINPNLRKLNPDPLKDLSPVTQLMRGGLILVANPSLPAKSLSEFIEIARSRPGKLGYASFGNGSLPHLSMALFSREAKIELLHVPYKGAGGALTELLAGQTDVMFDAPFTAIPHIRSGKLKALALTGLSRSAVLPGVPTLSEIYPRLSIYGWFGVFVPVTTPREIVSKLSLEIAKLVQTAEMQKLITDQNWEPVGSSAEQFSETVRQDAARWARVIRETGAAAE
jgi:tripartite-type tricarboxylate transporter receptor subunit TctC